MISGFDAVNLVGVATATLALGYAAFWALTVRRALAIRVYQKQALGIAFMSSVNALMLLANTASAYFVFHDPYAALGQSGYGLFFVFLIALLYWIDASVSATRRSDPMSRDTLHWSKLRIALWAGTLPAAILVISVSLYSLIAQGGYYTPAPPSLGIIFFLGIFIPPVAGVIMLPIIRRRAADQALRDQLKWFGLFAGAFIVFNLLLGNGPDGFGLLFGYVGWVVDGFCLFKSVSALAPLKAVRQESQGQP